MTIHQIDGESPVFEFATAKQIEGIIRRVDRKVSKKRGNTQNLAQIEGLKRIQKRERAQYQPDRLIRNIRSLADVINEDE